MSEQQKKAAVPAAETPAPAAAEVAAEVTTPAVAAAEAAPATPATKAPATPATKAAATRARKPRKPSTVDETVARHQKVLAEALEQAQAIKYDQPQVLAPAKAAKPRKADKGSKAEKPAKAKKPRLVRDSYAMPEAEYARIGELKKRVAALGGEVKKSELLRAGIAVLAGLDDAGLQAVLARVERIKTGRPAK
jgi:isopentenyl diphosphate isomerase/L-lactate dehydrogenase-like FMN-dependent dehydrogenase